MSAFQPGDRVQILVGRHEGKSGKVHSLDGEGIWVRPDDAYAPAPYEVYELAPEDDGTEAESIAVVEVPRHELIGERCSCGAVPDGSYAMA